MVSPVGTPKNRVDATKVNNIDELTIRISEEFATIPVQHLQNAVETWRSDFRP